MATISVLNTTSDLSGKTLVTAEGDRTLTGLLSFSRGGGAPFAVNVGAGNVANLDADKLDGLDSLAFVKADGTVAMTGGLTISAGQIVFPNTQSPSAGANTLDDYEEGLWSPTDISGAGLTFTYPTTGAYVKIGQLVVLTWSVLFPATASGTPAAITTPFVSMGGAQFSGGLFYTTYSVAPFMALLNAGSNTIQFFTYGGAGLTNANLSGKDLRGTAIYRAST